MADYPEPLENDPDEVVTALEVGAAMWTRGETTEALHWLRKAVDEAFDAGLDERGLTLSKTAATLASLPPPPPSVRAPEHSPLVAAQPPPAPVVAEHPAAPPPPPAMTKMRARTPPPPPPTPTRAFIDRDSPPLSGATDSAPPKPSRTGRPVARSPIPRTASRGHRAAQGGPAREKESATIPPTTGETVPAPVAPPPTEHATAGAPAHATGTDVTVTPRTRTASGVSQAATGAASAALTGKAAGDAPGHEHPRTDESAHPELTPPVLESDLPPSSAVIALLSDEKTLAAFPIVAVKSEEDTSTRPTFDPKFMTPFAMPSVTRAVTPPRPASLVDPPEGSTRPALPEDSLPPEPLLAELPEERSSGTGVIPIVHAAWPTVTAMRVIVSREAGRVVLRSFEQLPLGDLEVEAILVASGDPARLAEILRDEEPLL